MANKDEDFEKKVANGIRKQKARESNAGCLLLIGLVVSALVWVFTTNIIFGLIVFIGFILLSRIGYWKH
ncbi:hypothetical protein [Lacticaseibacillus paracasei]|uniref:hypothetical protein n=1 Tax=Lacticaseibacillus paracasei TaxID=1597 RepID=UPI0021C47B1E|nr:hypothetical protein [Lacticaseibacillus paracasei]MCP9304613.1 hypothetical protein [Lacticaseibacillus paracasei]